MSKKDDFKEKFESPKMTAERIQEANENGKILTEDYFLVDVALTPENTMLLLLVNYSDEIIVMREVVIDQGVCIPTKNDFTIPVSAFPYYQIIMKRANQIVEKL